MIKQVKMNDLTLTISNKVRLLISITPFCCVVPDFIY